MDTTHTPILTSKQRRRFFLTACRIRYRYGMSAQEATSTVSLLLDAVQSIDPGPNTNNYIAALCYLGASTFTADDIEGYRQELTDVVNELLEQEGAA